MMLVRWLISKISKMANEYEWLSKEWKEILFFSSIQQVKDFEQGAVWKDIVAFTTIQMIGLRDQLSTAREHNDIIHIQGELYRCSLFLDLPKMLIQAMEMKGKDHVEE